MANLLRWLLMVTALLVFVVIGFNVYTYFLVDYSLESLETALAATEKLDLASDTVNKGAGDSSQLASGIYRSMVDDIAMREITKDKVDFKNVALLEMTSRSFSEASDKEGYKRAKVYLKELTKAKKSERGAVLKWVDSGYRQILKFYKSACSVLDYFRRKLAPGTEKEENSPQYSNVLILNQAQVYERKMDFKKAADLYRKYLSFYPTRPDRGLVMVALANVLIKQGRGEEAGRLLRDVESRMAGTDAAAMAARVLERISFLNSRLRLIDRLKTLIQTEPVQKIKQRHQLQLALTYFSIYRFQEAESLLQKLGGSEELDIRRKAKFYLGFVYKATSRYGQSEKLFLDLLGDKDLTQDLELGLRAELADIYYQKGDSQKALEQYAFLSRRAKQRIAHVDEAVAEIKQQQIVRQAIDEVWVALAELEQATIYFFDLNEPDKAREHLGQAGGFSAADLNFEKISDSMGSASKVNLRDRAFKALAARQVGVAYELFTKNLNTHPDDAWTYGGLSTVHLLLGDLGAALTNAEKSYQLSSDEYTASMMGYIQGLNRHYGEAAEMYRQAFEKNRSYIPARFNYACMLLKMKEWKEALSILSEIENEAIGLNIAPIVHAKVLNNIGYALWRQGEKDKAVESFEKALTVYPGFSAAEKNLRAASGRLPKLVEIKG